MKEVLREIPFFAFCADEDLDKLLSSPYRLSVYKAGELIVSQDEPCKSLVLLTSGSVTTKMHDVDGRVVTMESLVAPQPIAPAFLFASRGNFPVDVVANEICEVWHIDKEGFFSFMQTHPSVLRIFLQTISDKG